MLNIVNRIFIPTLYLFLPYIFSLDKEFVGNDLKEIEYDGSNMNAPQILLDYLDHNLNKVRHLWYWYYIQWGKNSGEPKLSLALFSIKTYFKVK